MAKSSGVGNVLVLGAVGVGAYFAWPWLSSFFSGLTAAPATPSVAPVQNTVGGPIAPANPPAAPVVLSSPVCGAGQALNVASNTCVPVPSSSGPGVQLDLCGGVNPTLMALIMQLVGQGIDPSTNSSVATLETVFGNVPPACMTSQTVAAQLQAQALKAAGITIPNAGMGAAPTMWRATRRNYVRVA